MTDINDRTTTELEAAAFRRLVAHLRERGDVQNIDLMNLAGFCRNCLANWYQEAAKERGISLSKDQSRGIIYGMPYADWQASHKKQGSREQLTAIRAGSSQGPQVTCNDEPWLKNIWIVQSLGLMCRPTAV